MTAGSRANERKSDARPLSARLRDLSGIVPGLEPELVQLRETDVAEVVADRCGHTALGAIPSDFNRTLDRSVGSDVVAGLHGIHGTRDLRKGGVARASCR